MIPWIVTTSACTGVVVASSAEGARSTDGTGDLEFERSLEPLADGETDRVREARPCDDLGVCCCDASGDGAALVLLLLAEPLTSSSAATCLGHMVASIT